MLRRLLPAVAVVLALSIAGAGCADDVAPAARIGDLTITHDELMDEVAQWSKSPRLVALLMGEGAEVGEAGRYNAELVTLVLTNRISFEVWGAELEERGLEVDPALVDQVRTGLFQNPADSAQVLEELDPAFGDRLVADIAAQSTVQTELGDGLRDFAVEAFGDVEVNPRYGTWDPQNGIVVPPEGPRPSPDDTLGFEL